MWSRFFGCTQTEPEPADLSTEPEEPEPCWLIQASADLSMLKELLKFLDTAVWIGSFIDLAASLSPWLELELSLYGLTIGGGIGLLAALGSGYVHYALNQSSLPKNRKKLRSDYAKEELSFLQMAAIPADFTMDIGEVAGGVLLLCNYTIKNYIGYWGKVGINVGAAVAGGIFAIAQANTAVDGFKRYNSIQKQIKREADIENPREEEMEALNQNEDIEEIGSSTPSYSM